MNQDSSKLQTSSSVIPARVLATLIDYFFVVVSASLIERAYPMGQFSFVIFLAFASLYYGVSNSVVMKGQTIGKKIFGLSTITISNRKEDSLYLPLGYSFLRFIILLGAINILIALPPILYREFLIEQDRIILDIPQLLALIIFFGNVATAIAHSHQRALHDIICGSAVVRHFNDKDPTTVDLRQLAKSYYNPLIGFTFGTFFGALLWFLSISQPKEIQLLSKKQFTIEQKLSIRLLNAYYGEGNIFLTVLLLDEHSNDANCQIISEQIALTLENDLKQNKVKEITTTCYNEDGQESGSSITLSET